MKVDIPVEVLDERCMECGDLDIQISFYDVLSGTTVYAREWYNQCSHLELCKRLKERHQKNDG